MILRGTGAGSVIGHSSGGYIALVAAQLLAIDRIVLYDAAVSVDGGFPAGWLPAARAAADSGDMARCMALTPRGSTPTSRRPACRWSCRPCSAGCSCAPVSAPPWAHC